MKKLIAIVLTVAAAAAACSTPARRPAEPPVGGRASCIFEVLSWTCQNAAGEWRCDDRGCVWVAPLRAGNPLGGAEAVPPPPLDALRKTAAVEWL